MPVFPATRSCHACGPDEIRATRFFAPHVRLAEWLAPHGTIFFETFTCADAKYRPEFNPAHRFDTADIPAYFSDCEILYQHETDNGKRVYVTIVAKRV